MRQGVLIHVQHLLGIGHYDRALRVAAALAASGQRVHLISGGVPVPGVVPAGVEIAQLPPLRVADASFRPLLDAGGRPIDEAYRDSRRDRLLSLYDALQPSVVMLETFPFGRRALRFELLPLLERIARMRPRPAVFSSVRDILQPTADAEREREMHELARRYFDGILVHADCRFARFEEAFATTSALPPVHYTGFVAPPPRASVPAPSRGEVVVSAGGGAVGSALLFAALEARAQSRYATLTWRLLAGPNLPQADLDKLARSAREGVVIERSRGDFAERLRNARVSVSQAGYNTVLEVMASGARAVIVPFTDHGQVEQSRRAARLAGLELAIVVDPPTPEALARAVDEACTRERWGRWDFDCEGAERTATLIGDWLRSQDTQPAPA